MRYLLIVGHAGIAEGIVSAFEMLMGSREYVIACGLTAQSLLQAPTCSIKARLRIGRILWQLQQVSIIQ